MGDIYWQVRLVIYLVKTLTPAHVERGYIYDVQTDSGVIFGDQTDESLKTIQKHTARRFMAKAKNPRPTWKIVPGWKS